MTSFRHDADSDGISSSRIPPQEGGQIQKDNDEWRTFENNGFTRSEAQERLLAGEDPRHSHVVGDSNPSTTLPENRSSIAGLRLKDYAPKTLWNSVWLHKVVLLGFCALFTAIFSALILLYHFSNAHHGLSTESSKNKYSWTYGPTAGRFSSTSRRPQSSVDCGQFSSLSPPCGDKLTINAKRWHHGRSCAKERLQAATAFSSITYLHFCINA